MKKVWQGIGIGMLAIVCFLIGQHHAQAQEKVGVLYVIHGGFDEYREQHLFDCSVQLFAVRPDHIVNRVFVWNKELWGEILGEGNAKKEVGKYSFNYGRLGGSDPFHVLSDIQLDQIEAKLNAQACSNVSFVVDYAAWMSGDRPWQYPYPRYLYNPPDYIRPRPMIPAENISQLTYCGEQERRNAALDFSGGTTAFTVGATLAGPSGATAVIDDVAVLEGSWAGGNAEGRLYLSGLTYQTGYCARGKGVCSSNDDCPGGATDPCVGYYFNDAESITDASGGAAVASGTNRWPDCDPHRFDVDGPAERFIAAGVDRIVAVDMTTGGTRFFKTWDVLYLFKKALADNGYPDMPVEWVNDPEDIMNVSRPIEPVGVRGDWTADLMATAANIPKFVDISVPLAGSPNPIMEDPALVELHVEAIEANMVPWEEETTGIVLLNHATRDWDQYWDPKIDDTVVINQNIKSLLLARHPIDPDNIVGAFMGVMEDGSDEGYSGNERTRNMRGENLGHAWLYEQPNKTLPGDEWGHLYWEALEYLKNRGVTHIVIGFPQIVTDSVLNLVEIHNQIGKEIGRKNWLYWGVPDYDTYPGIGHPFADYWGVWVDTDCGGVPCCFEMGGCSDGRPYPPPRQVTWARDDMDPSLAYDVSDYGHLGYDETGASGPVNPNGPVLDQYTGSWAMYSPPNDDKRLAALLANHVLMAVACEPTLIELAAFSAKGLVNSVMVTWTTASEIDNAGFNVYRADSEDGPYVKINPALIPSRGDTTLGHTYRFPDRGARRGKTYSYKLEDIDLNGTSTMHGPVSATPGLLNLFR